MGDDPNWVSGYVPPADEWNDWWSRKLDETDPLVSGGPYLPIAGGTVTGPVTFSGSVTLPTSTTGPFLPLAGGTVTGDTTFNGALNAGNGGSLAGTFSGSPTLSGALTLSGPGTALSVTNNVSVGGTLLTTGTMTSAGTSFIQAGNATGTNNVIRVTPATAGTDPSLSLVGPDANRSLRVNPLGTGALISGRMNAGNNGTFNTSAAALVPIFQGLGGLTGSLASGSTSSAYNFTISNDTVDASLVSNGLFGFQIAHAYGNNAAMKNGRYALTVQSTLLGATGNFAAGINPFYGVANLWQTINGNEGGTAPTLAGAWGQSVAINPQIVAAATATNWLELSIAEFNVSVKAGASTARKFGIKISPISADVVQGSVSDAGLKFGGSAGVAGWKNAILFGGDISAWTAPGTIIKGAVGSATGANLPSSVAGIDFSQIAFPARSTSNAVRGFLLSNAFNVDGVGSVQVGTSYLSPGSVGLSVDAAGIVGTGTPTVAAGGSNYGVGDFLFDAWGGVYKVATVSSGAVVTVTVYSDANSNARQPYYPSPTPPANPVATTAWGNSTGSGCTLNLTWDGSRNGLSLNPTGQRIGFNGTAPIAKPTVTGSKGANAALASLLTALANYGLVTDSST